MSLYERLYCICKKPSEGEMCCCDNEQCKHEWFHIKCIQTITPYNPYDRNTWYCPFCQQEMEIARTLLQLSSK